MLYSYVSLGGTDMHPVELPKAGLQYQPEAMNYVLHEADAGHA
jgi:hypothetical protein